MERSEDLGEECCSSESGWTMYIASPMHENKNHDDDGGGADDSRKEVEDEADYGGDRKEEEGSDDSMASDASSGPSHHQMVLRDFKHAKGIQQRKILGKSPHKKAEKSKCDRKLKPKKDFSGNGKKTRKPS